MADIFSSEKRSEIMSKIKSKNSEAELLIRKALYALGLRYRIHDKRVIGKPDIVFLKHKLAIFIDGDWWHGRNYDRENYKYNKYWKEKILSNMNRDRKVENELKSIGWKTLRFWEKDIKKDPLKYALIISAAIQKRKNQ